VVALDGIRGLAALYVVLYHTFLRSFTGPDTAPVWAAWLGYGRFAVVVFIVLSGFSLAIVPARSGWQLDGGLSRFAFRRAWRILPPYWPALVFSLLVAWLVIHQPGQLVPDAKSVVVNGLLVQNVLDAPSPNRAFWSIAIEAQLYVMFPLLLLIIRRAGPVVLLAGAYLAEVAVGIWVAPATLLKSTPDLAALFATGVVAAGILRAGQRVRSWPWPWLAVAAAAPVVAATAWAGTSWTMAELFWVDLALGPAIACLLVAVATDRPTPLVRLLDTRPLRRLGSFSYSLYLTHAPIVTVVCDKVLAGRIRTGTPSLLISLAIAVPATIGFAWLFGSVFEIPFQRHRGWTALRDAVSRRLPGSVRPREVSVDHN
jgi:peptidoglycan/LPS O-acetylase OafA/YrhL